VAGGRATLANQFGIWPKRSVLNFNLYKSARCQCTKNSLALSLLS